VFQVIHKKSGRRRIRTITTIHSSTDKSETAKLSLFVQLLSLWSEYSQEQGPLHFLADCDPMWVVPDDIAPVFYRVSFWSGVVFSRVPLPVARPYLILLGRVLLCHYLIKTAPQ